VFTSASINTIDLEIRWQRLIAVMDEVDTATVKTSFSTIVGESRDFACILLDPRGASLCQSSFSPPDFCVSITRTSRVCLERHPIHTLEPGDVLVTNDPWIGDGHLPDYFVLTPVFWKGKVVAFMGTVAHVADVGGHPGDIVAADVFSEGVRVPPAKLYEAGRENELLVDVIGGNCRVPEMVLGDLRAIVGTHRVGARRLAEFLEDERLDDLDALAREIHGRSEALMRDRIEAWPDGRYEFGLDIDGYLQPLHLHATVTIRGRDVLVDYAGTSREVEGAAINCTYNTTRSSTMYPFKCALVPAVPNNEGLFAPITVVAPEGCVLNTTFPHPVKARAKTTNNINQVLFGALWPVLGEHAQAGSGSIWPFSVSGRTREHGSFSVYVLPHGGRGAMRDLDGMVPIAFPHNSAVTPVEVFETQCPVRITCKALRPDSGGAGRTRGGLGQVMTFKHVGDEAIAARVRPDKITYPAPGLAGGAKGAPGRVLFNGRELREFPILPFAPGDEITLEIPGGAGFGSPAARPRASIDRDVALGYLTPAGRDRAYGTTEVGP
jgi:N-methylhydantoinase B